VVLRGLAWYGLCKAWTSWRGSARCSMAVSGQVQRGYAWHGFRGLVRYGQVRRVMVGRGFLGEVKCGMAW